MEVRICLLLAVLLFVIWMAFVPAYPAPIAQAVDGDVTVILTDEPCKLKEVTNLPYRAIYKEKNKVYEGCAGGHPGGIIMFYFDDKTVAAAPAGAFQRMRGI